MLDFSMKLLLYVVQPLLLGVVWAGNLLGYGSTYTWFIALGYTPITALQILTLRSLDRWK